MWRRGLIPIWTVALLVAGGARAQEAPPEEREGVHQKIETLMKWRMLDEVDITEEEGAKLFPALRRIEGRRRELREQSGRLMDELRATLRGVHPDEEALRRTLAGLEESQRGLESLAQEETRTVGGILPLEKQARYLLFRERFERDVRDIVHDIRERRPPLPSGRVRPPRLRQEGDRPLEPPEERGR